MEAATVVERRSGKKNRSTKAQSTRPTRNAYDRELIQASIDKSTIDIVLAVDLPIPRSQVLHAVDDNDIISVKVLHVDTYAVKFDLGGHHVWISKAFIVAVYP